MEQQEKINIAALLKDCPKGTKLYSPICGECELQGFFDESKLISVKDHIGNGWNFTENGYYSGLGECLLFPSKENRDWSTFKAPQKEQPKFKVGDVVIIDGVLAVVEEHLDNGSLGVCCIDIKSRIGDKFEGISKAKPYTMTLREINKKTLEPNHLHYSKSKRKIICWFSPKDDVVVRRKEGSEWMLARFSHYSHRNIGGKYCADAYFMGECLPYNEETAKLIGTTDDWEEE